MSRNLALFLAVFSLIVGRHLLAQEADGPRPRESPAGSTSLPAPVLN